MTLSETIRTWRSIFKPLGIELEPTDTPMGISGPSQEQQDGQNNADGDQSEYEWFLALAYFGRRGFLRLTTTPHAQKSNDQNPGAHDQKSVFVAELAMPDAETHYVETLITHLIDISSSQWSLLTEDNPWTLKSGGVGADDAPAVVEVFQRVTDHIRAVEEGARSAVLAQEFGGVGSRRESGESRSQNDEKSGIERSENQESNSPFESIGTGSSDEGFERQDKNSDNGSEKPKSTQKTRDSATLHGATHRVEAGEAGFVTGFRVSVRDGVIHAGLEISSEGLGRREETRLLNALSDTLQIRYDLTLLSCEWAKGEVRLAARANIESETGQLAHDLGRYFERLKKFGALGMSLAEVLAPGTSRDRSRGSTHGGKASSRQRRHSSGGTQRRHSSSGTQRRHSSGGTQRRDSSGGTQRREYFSDSSPAQEGGEVVFSFGPSSASVGDEVSADGLQPGNFTDPRIRREDATTSLVDVVLRHPGYSDKNMRQVLSILLDINYVDAEKLVAQAPCLIGWSVSHDRAREFKSVIEGAGGRVTLVEPDSLT